MNVESSVKARTPVTHQPIAVPPLARRRSNRKRLLFWIRLVVLLGLVSVVIWRLPDNRVAVTTEKAIVREITQNVTATGKIRPDSEIKISPDVAGEITELPVVDGQKVEKGQLLAKIKPDNYIANVKQQQAALDAAEADCLQTKSQMLNAELDFHRSEDLFLKKLISETDFHAALTKQEVSEASYQGALHRIAQARGVLDQAKDSLSKCDIYSPIAGTISALNCELGERVVGTNDFAGTEIMRVANLTSLEARVDVNENDVVQVKVGDEVHIHLDAYPGHDFRGLVRRIASTATVQNQGTQQEVTNFEVRIAVLAPDRQIRPGMSVNVVIDTQTVQQAVSIPVQAVTVRSKDTGKTKEEMAQDRRRDQAGATETDAEKRDRKKLERIVFLKQGKNVKAESVVTGIADDNYIQIVKGVDVGDEVVSGPYTALSKTLKDGSPIKIEQNQNAR